MDLWLGFWRALWLGSSRITGVVAGWLQQGLLLRLGSIVLVAGFCKGLPFTGRIVQALVAAWVVTALVLGYRTPDPDAAPGPVLDPADVARALHAVADPHAHLQPVADRLGVLVPTLREALQAMGVPVSRGVRMKGRRVSTGVKRGDLPPLPPPPVAAPEGVLTSDNNSNSAPSGATGEGLRVEPIGQSGSVVRVPGERRAYTV